MCKCVKYYINRLFGLKPIPYNKSDKAADIKDNEPSDLSNKELIGPFTANQASKLEESGSIVFDVIEWASKLFITSAGTAVAKQLYTDFIESKESKQFNAIMDKLNSIESMVKDFIDLYKNTEYEKVINTRSKYIFEMVNNFNEYNNLLTNAFNKGAVDDEVFKILNEWSNTTIGGNSAKTQFMNFIDFILSNKVMGSTLYQIYDIYVYNTTPWENMGYEKRETLRYLDMGIIAAQAQLALLYYKYNPEMEQAVKDMQIKKVSDKMAEYIDYYKNMNVIRRNDVAVCQIPGAHIEIQKGLIYRDYYSMPWFPKGTTWDDEHGESAWVVLWGADCVGNFRKAISENEFNSIVNYYKDSSKYPAFIDILNKDANMGIPNYGGIDLYMQMQSDAYKRHDQYNDYFLGCDNVCIINKNKTKTSETIGSAYLDTRGFLWLERYFNRWASLDLSHKWCTLNIVKRY